MSGHVTLRTHTDGDRTYNIVEASWSDGGVEVHLGEAGAGGTRLDGLRLRLDGTAVTEIVRAVTRFATDTDLGVIE
jgi:hypothetical protein